MLKKMTPEAMRREAHRFVTRNFSTAPADWLAQEIVRTMGLPNDNAEDAAYRAGLVMEYATLIADRINAPFVGSEE